MLTAAAYPTASDRDSERTLMVAPRAQDLEGLRSRDDEPTSVERNPVTQPSRTRRAAPRVRRIRRLESAPKMVLEVEDDSSSVVDLPVPDLAAIEVYRASHLWTATAPVATRADVTADRFEATVISKRTKRPVRPVILAATAGILVGLSALQVAAGNAQTCARLDDGSVKCWGSNFAGELGLGDTQTRGDGPGQMGAALPVVQLK
jgi:hypothetical protein